MKRRSVMDITCSTVTIVFKDSIGHPWLRSGIYYQLVSTLSSNSSLLAGSLTILGNEPCNGKLNKSKRIAVASSLTADAARSTLRIMRVYLVFEG